MIARAKDEMRVEMDAKLASVLGELAQSRAELAEAKGELGVRLSTCEASSTALQVEADGRARARRLQEADTCQGAGLRPMLAGCCAADAADPAGGGGGHRRTQTGCTGFPTSCSATCAPLLVEYYEGCQGIVEAMEADERAGFESLYGSCKEAEQVQADVADVDSVNLDGAGGSFDDSEQREH